MAFSVALGGAWAPSAGAAEALAWVAPNRARVVAWGDGAGGPAVEVDPSSPVGLGAGEVLILPVEPGERLEIRGDVDGIGLGSGLGEAPDVITWMPLSPPGTPTSRAREVGVPAWSSARFVALRGPSAGATVAEVSVRVAARESAPLAWYRLDEDVAGWLEGRGGPPPAAPIEAAALLRWVTAARDALAYPAVGSRPSAPAAAWLVSRYLEESMRVRPLLEPYFVRRDIDVEGGREAEGLPAIERATAWRTAPARRGVASRITLRAPGADVVRIALRARALGAARAVVRVGGAVVRELAWRTAPRVADGSRWIGPQWIRVVLPIEAREVTVEVAEGEIAAAAIGYRQRVGVAEFFAARRDRAALLDRAVAGLPGEGGAGAVRVLAAADRAFAPAASNAAVARAGAPGTPAPVRTLLLSEAVRRAASPAEARARAADAFVGEGGVADPIGAPLLRAALERLAAVHADPVASSSSWAGWGAVAARRPGVDPDDHAALSALSEALGPVPDGRRPLAGPAAERFASERGEIAAAAPRARQAWAREAPWDALEAVSEGVPLWSSIEVPRDVVLPSPGDAGAPMGGERGSGQPGVPEGDPGGALCEVAGPQGLRWTVLDAPRAEIDVNAPPGAYARVLLRGLSTDAEPESSVIVDGVAVAVHAGAGVASVLAVAPGARAFERSAGSPPVLARVPREGKAPCAGLREITSWAWVNRAATFAVPDRERATVARVVVAPASVAVAAGARHAGPAHLFHVRVGGVTYPAWVRPGASGAIEVPVPRGARELRVEADAAALVRASARLHPAPSPPPRAVIPRTGGPNGPIEMLLETVRGATRGLRGAAAPARPMLHEQRATALELLGFQALAELDRGPPPPLDVLEAEGAPSTTFALPPGSPPVVPLGLLARVVPLPLPGDLAPLRAARAAHHAGDPRRGVEALAGPAAASSGADALLLALLAERAGVPGEASDAFTRIGLELGSGPALARAASLATDVAAADRKRVSTLRAYALSELAVQAGELPPGSLARLAPVIGWRAPPRADQTAGSAALEIRAKNDRDLPLRVRVRRALLDAPEGALLVTEGAYAQFHFRFDGGAGEAVVLDGACRALDPAETPCDLAVTLDGVPVECASAGVRGGGAGVRGGGAGVANGSVGALLGDLRAPIVDAGAPGAGALRCAVQVPRGSHRIEVRPPSDGALLAWVRATGADAPAPYPGRVMSTWQDIDPERPLELAFAGPTVVRLRARAAYECAGDAAPRGGAGEDPTCHPTLASAAAPAGALRFTVEALGKGGLGPRLGAPPDRPAAGAPRSEGTLALDATEDRTARRTGVSRAPFFWLGDEVEQRVAVLPEGPHILRVTSPAGRALLRVEIAVATGVPRPREELAPPPPDLEFPVVEWPRPAPRVGEDPDVGPLLLGAYAHLVDADLTEDELRTSTRFLELGVDAHRELLEARAWAGLAVFGRLRAATPSVGAEARLDTAGDSWIPAVAILGRAVLQPPGAGGRVSLGATWSIPVEELTLLPWASLALLAVDEGLADEPGADRDVFTPYAASHTTQASLGARLRMRPAVDAILAAGPSLRLSPLPSTLDRVDLRADLDLLAGRGLFPWIQIGWLTSLRPENETRSQAFVRHAVSGSVTFWSWLSGSSRVSLAGEGSILFDVPQSSLPAPRFGAGLLARYDWTGGRGLRDLPPRDTPFRDRLEEGSGVVGRERPAAEPTWEEAE